jgi:hypothetical protein
MSCFLGQVGVVGRNFVREAVDVDDATVRRKTHYVYPKDCCKVHTRLIAPDDSMATCGESGEAAASWCDDADLHGARMPCLVFVIELYWHCHCTLPLPTHSPVYDT